MQYDSQIMQNTELRVRTRISIQYRIIIDWSHADNCTTRCWYNDLTVGDRIQVQPTTRFSE